MNIAQHLARSILKNFNCKHVFTLTGGGAMFLNDAFGNEENLSAIYCHHEQAASMAAVGYAKLNGFATCVTTTGCGATNTLTGLLDAWQDNVPILYISGQVKKKETSYLLDNKVRGFGVQEANIIPIVKSITKKAYFIDSLEAYKEFLCNLQSDLFSGRPGPVWADIPMDLQSLNLSNVEISSLDKILDESINKKENESYSFDIELSKLIDLLSKSIKPIFLIGNGLRLSNHGKGIEKLKEISLKLSVPIVSTYLGVDFYNIEFKNYFGVVGLKATRAANLLINNADLVICIGTRLATSVIGFEYNDFAPNAKKVIIDIDEIEHKKPTINNFLFIKADAYQFLNKFFSSLKGFPNVFKQWLYHSQQAYKLLPKQEQFSTEDEISIFDAVKQICCNSGNNDVIVSDAGSSYYVTSMMFSKIKNQRYVTSGAQADMGFGLPAAIGCAFAKIPNKRVHAIIGDGSFQLNLQELQTIKHYNLPVSIYILNNNGYLSIRATQKNFFPGRDCGTDNTNGVSFPELEKIAFAYNLNYVKFNNQYDLAKFVLKTEKEKLITPHIIEIICPKSEEIIPRSQTIKTEEGKLYSAKLSNMAPTLSKDIKKKLNEIDLKI